VVTFQSDLGATSCNATLTCTWSSSLL